MNDHLGLVVHKLLSLRLTITKAMKARTGASDQTYPQNILSFEITYDYLIDRYFGYEGYFQPENRPLGCNTRLQPNLYAPYKLETGPET